MPGDLAEAQAKSSPGPSQPSPADCAKDQALDQQLQALQQRRNAAPRSPYEELRRRLGREIDALSAEIGNALERHTHRPFVGYFNRGVYDVRQAMQAEFQRSATGRAPTKVFKRRAEPEHRSSEVIFCIDISASMEDHGRIEGAREAAVVFQEALSQLQIPYGIIAYNGAPEVLAALGHIESEPRAQVLAKLVPGGQTNASDALKLARDMFAQSQATDKIVFFLTDGGVAKDCKALVQQTAAETGIKIFGIGIGGGCGEVPNIFEHHVVVPSVKELPLRTGELLLEVLR